LPDKIASGKAVWKEFLFFVLTDETLPLQQADFLMMAATGKQKKFIAASRFPRLFELETI
jgi:hypothetical protein